MGLRGARLAAVYPALEAMQVRALAWAYVDATRQGAQPAPLSITVPMIDSGAEMEGARRRISAVLAEVENASGAAIPVRFGGMIETPRAALDAAAIARH